MTTPSIFRESAVERVVDPEQLDRLLVVSTRPAWAGLLAVWLVIAAVAVWAFTGRLPTTIEGSGILLSTGGLRDMAALSAGVVASLPVQAGDVVRPGTVLATVRQPLLEQQVRLATDLVRALQLERDTRGAFVQRGASVEVSRLDAARADIERRARALAERVRYLEGRVAAEREARALGLVTESVVQASVAALESARGEQAFLALELKQNELRRIQTADEGTERVTEVSQRLLAAERDLTALRLELEQASQIVSTQQGTVREVRTAVGQLIAAGQPIISVELVDSPLQAVVFIARDAKKVASGMRVRISPAAVPVEEFGYIVGTVRSVSTQPATLAGMTRTLGNDVLVQQLSAVGTSFLVEVDLERDTSTASGFRWSSKNGPPMVIGSGSIIRGAIEVQRRRPIELLVPYLRRLAGLSA